MTRFEISINSPLGAFEIGVNIETTALSKVVFVGGLILLDAERNEKVTARSVKNTWTSFASRSRSVAFAGQGLLRTSTAAGPLAVHGVQSIMHPPTHLRTDECADTPSFLVFITRELPAIDIERSYRSCASMSINEKGRPNKSGLIVFRFWFLLENVGGTRARVYKITIGGTSPSTLYFADSRKTPPKDVAYSQKRRYQPTASAAFRPFIVTGLDGICDGVTPCEKRCR